MRKFLILLIVVLAATPLSAQWRQAGLFGADVRSLIADANDPDTLFLGTSGGEVYISTDAAKSWKTARHGIPFPGYVVDNLILDRDGRLWAACWGLWGGGVVAVSEDKGKSWVRRDAGLEDFSVRAIAIDPNDPGFVIVGGLTGVYKSTDSGKSWNRFSEHVNVESLAIDPRTRERIYVGTWRQGWRTDDGGKEWTHISNGMVLDTDMFSITINPSNPDNIWVSTCGWVYGTENRGDKWTRYRDGFTNRRIHEIELDPCDPGTVYAGSVAGLYRSDDNGKSWYTVSDEEMVINSVVLHPQRPERIILGIEGDGVYVSNDRAKSFQRMSEGLHNLRITAVVADARKKDRVYAAVGNGGAASGVYESDDAGRAWRRVSVTKLPEILSLTIAQEEDAEVRFLAGTEKGFFWSADGATWTQAAPSSFPIRVEKLARFNRLRSFAATSEGVFTTRDAGKSWYRLAQSQDRAIDIAIGTFADRKALYALKSSGVAVFDGEKWIPIQNGPATGRTIAVRLAGGVQQILVAGAEGVFAGRISADGRWLPSDAPDARYASVFGSTRADAPVLFLTSRQQREILVGAPAEPDWLELTLPKNNTEITTVAPDPFADRYYVGTVGEGVYIFEGTTRRYVRKIVPPETAGAVAGDGAAHR